MTFYRAALAFFLVGNVILFVKYMYDYDVPWNAAMLFFGFILANGPILVSIQFSSKIDETLSGHWLNWLNILNPLLTGTIGLLTYGLWVHSFGGHPAIFMVGPLLINMMSLLLLVVVIHIYIFVDDR